MILLHDKARLPVATLLRACREILYWEVLSQPPNSPDLGPSNYLRTQMYIGLYLKYTDFYSNIY